MYTIMNFQLYPQQCGKPNIWKNERAETCSPTMGMIPRYIHHDSSQSEGTIIYPDTSHHIPSFHPSMIFPANPRIDGEAPHSTISTNGFTIWSWVKTLAPNPKMSWLDVLPNMRISGNP
jgi:hypothetical protein